MGGVLGEKKYTSTRPRGGGGGGGPLLGALQQQTKETWGGKKGARRGRFEFE